MNSVSSSHAPYMPVVPPLAHEPAVFERPVILPPLEARLVDVQDEMKTNKKAAETAYTDLLRGDQKYIQSLYAEQKAALQRAAEEAKVQGTYDTLIKFGTYVASFLSALAGIALLPVNPILGGSIIAAAVLALGTNIATDLGLFHSLAQQIAGADKELAGKIECIIPAILSLISFSLSLMGGSLWQLLDSQAKVLALLSALSNVISGGGKIGLSVSEAKNMQNEQDLTELRHKIYVTQTKSQRLINAGLNFINVEMGKASSQIANALRLSIQELNTVSQR